MIKNDTGWLVGTVIEFDTKSSQIKVKFKFNNNNYGYWVHFDNTQEIRMTSCYPKICYVASWVNVCFFQFA